jgi:hypothetical protein
VTAPAAGSGRTIQQFEENEEILFDLVRDLIALFDDDDDHDPCVADEADEALCWTHGEECAIWWGKTLVAAHDPAPDGASP